MLAVIEKEGVLFLFIPEKEHGEHCDTLCNIQTISDEVYAARRFKYHEFKLARQFVQHLARAHKLDGFFSQQTIEKAIKDGAIPEGYDVHHILPLNLGGENTFDNLCLIDRKAHKYYHSEILDYVWSVEQTDKPMRLIVPRFGSVVTWNMAKDVLFTAEEIRTIEEKEVEAYLKKKYQTARKQAKGIKKQSVTKKKVRIWDVRVLNALHRRREFSAQSAQREEERKKARQEGKCNTSYKDSSKYHTSEIKGMRRLNRLFQHIKTPRDLQYGD